MQVGNDLANSSEVLSTKAFATYSEFVYRVLAPSISSLMADDQTMGLVGDTLMAGVNVLNCLQCFDTAASETGRSSSL